MFKFDINNQTFSPKRSVHIEEEVDNLIQKEDGSLFHFKSVNSNREKESKQSKYSNESEDEGNYLKTVKPDKKPIRMIKITNAVIYCVRWLR